MTEVEMKVTIDVQDAYDCLTEKERTEFIRDNIADCDIDVLLKEVSEHCDIEETINSFDNSDIENWLFHHAEEYDYAKIVDPEYD